MPEFITIAKTDEIPEGEARAFDANGVPVAVANVGGSFYAFDDTCTHRQCSLAEGEIEDTAIVCPCHGSEFDIRTGAVVAPPATEPVQSYEVRVEDGQIQVQVG
jgi:3-phenylpropionate/trans-cinnamate dioxygenase ferredoxin subunit